MAYRYRDEIVAELLAHGIRPTPETPPARVRDLLSDIYCYQLRRLRGAFLRQEFPKASFAGRVIDLRRRYFLLSIPVERWVIGDEPGVGRR